MPPVSTSVPAGISLSRFPSMFARSATLLGGLPSTAATDAVAATSPLRRMPTPRVFQARHAGVMPCSPVIMPAEDVSSALTHARSKLQIRHDERADGDVGEWQE